MDNQSIKVVDLEFEDFAEQLFRYSEPPASKTMLLDIKLEDPYDTLKTPIEYLLKYGIYIKYRDFLPFNLVDEHFEKINEYIKATGYYIKINSWSVTPTKFDVDFDYGLII